MPNLALTYLQKRKLAFGPTTLKLAIGIVGDCLIRGMLLSGSSKFKPGESLPVVIQRGLQHRELVHSIVSYAVKETDRDFRSHPGSRVGSLALDREHLSKVRPIEPLFVLKPDVTLCDTLAYTTQARSQILPQLAERVLVVVPQDLFPDANLDRFPNTSDRANLVRNAITSLCFREVAFPVISVEELRRFIASATGKVETVFSAAALSMTLKFFVSPDDPSREETSKFVTDLFTQVKEVFIRAAADPSVQPLDTQTGPVSYTAIRDLVYRQFEPFLLLLHPALEEKELITNPARHQEGAYSLWQKERSVVLRGVRVPNYEMLLAANRLAKAKGHDNSRFQHAQQAYRRLYRGQERQDQEREALTAQVQEFKDRMALPEPGEDELPYTITQLTRAFYPQTAQALARERTRLREYEQLIQTSEGLHTKAQGFFAELSALKASGFEGNVAVPDWARTHQLVLEKHGLAGKKAAAHRTIRLHTEILEESYALKDKDEAFRLARSWAQLPKAAIEAEIARLERTLKRGRNPNLKAVLVSGELGSAQAKEALDYLTARLEVVKVRVRGLKEDALPYDNQRLRELQALRNRVAKSHDVQGVLYVPTQAAVYRFLIQERLSALEGIRRAKVRIEEVDQRVVPAQWMWPRQQAEQWARTVLTATYIPNTLSQPELRLSLEQFQEQWLELDNSRKRVKGEPYFYRFARLTNHPLFPFSEVEGLPMKTVRDCILNRTRVIRAYLDIEQIRREEQRLQEEFTRLSRGVYQRYLEDQIREREHRLSILQSDPALSNFLETMRRLNLTLEEPS